MSPRAYFRLHKQAAEKFRREFEQDQWLVAFHIAQMANMTAPKKAGTWRVEDFIPLKRREAKHVQDWRGMKAALIALTIGVGGTVEEEVYDTDV